MKINKLTAAQSKSRLKLLHDCAGTLCSADALKSRLDSGKAAAAEKCQALQAARRQQLQGLTVNATLFNYQKALSAAELQAAALYRELQKNSGGNNKVLLASLRQTVGYYQKLRWEAEGLQAAFGCTDTVGLTDRESSDYFIAKLRCGAETADKQDLFGLLFTGLETKLQALAELDLGGRKLLNNDNASLYLLAADFLALMSAYEQAMQETFTVAAKWRQFYQDEAIVKVLVRASLKLAHVGALQPIAAADALVSVLRQYAVELSSVYEAEQASDEVIDCWTKMSADYGISVKHLAIASEQAAGAAYRAGLDFSCLQALLAGLLDTSKLDGELAGRYLRALLLWLGTETAAAQLAALGIERYKITETGQKHWRRLQEIILEAVRRQQTSAKNIGVLLENIAYGDFNAVDLGGLFGGYTALQQKLQTAGSAKGWSAARQRLDSDKIVQNLLELRQNAEQILKELRPSATDAGRELAAVLAELSAGLKKLQPEFIATFKSGTELLLLFKTILTVAEAALAKNQQGISAILGLHTMPAGKARDQYGGTNNVGH